MLLLLLALACDGPAALDDCATLAPADCAADPTCAVLDGRALTWPDTAACYDLGDAELLGCQDAARDCDEAITYAGPGDGTCFQFTNGCLPTGFVACDSDPNAVAACES